MNSETRCESPKGWTLFQCPHGSRVWLPQRCRHCDGCFNARRAKTIAKILAGLDGQKDISLLTLTSTPGTDWKRIMRAWQQMARWLRQTSPEMTYACIKEAGTRSGMKHLHVLMVNARFTPQSHVSAEWRRLTTAWVVDIQRVHSRKAAAYVAKYVAKGPAAARKSVTFGKRWPKLPRQEQTTQAIDRCGPWGPSKFTSVASSIGLVAFLAPDCRCYGDISPPTLEIHLWLKSIPARSSRTLAAG